MSGSILLTALITEYDLRNDVIDPAWDANIFAMCGPQLENDMYMRKTFIESSQTLMFFGAYHGWMTAKAYGADSKSFTYDWGKSSARAGILLGLCIPPLLGWLFSEDNNMYLVYFIYGAIPYYGLGYMMYGLAPIIFKYFNIQGSLPTEYKD